MKICFPASSTALTKSGSIIVSLITSRVSNLFVGSVADAFCVFIKNIVAIVGLPKSSNIVIDVELVKVSGLFGSNVYPSAN